MAYTMSRSDGKWQAQDLDQMSAMTQQMFGKGAVDTKDLAVINLRFEPTGRTETVAGYKGEFYLGT